tara:strand:- start:1510 stop:1896 length:387 start_codon:yes stop_codon:yes gene_type:complete
MRNFKNNRRRFRSNSFDRSSKMNANDQNLGTNLGNISDFKKRNFRNNFNSSKLIQKYSDLAREALSSGDKILYENYMQHAEHFIRVSENTSSNTDLKNSVNQNINKVSIGSVDEENSKTDNSLKAEEN